MDTFTVKCTPEECRLLAKEVRSNFVVLTDGEVLKQRAKLFQALGNEVRLRILGLLSTQEMCTCNIVEALEGSASTITHHLRMLEDGGLITSRRVGKFTVYRLIGDLLVRHRVFD
jgi:DNA-binding transcriptional ArsR family regulator